VKKFKAAVSSINAARAFSKGFGWNPKQTLDELSGEGEGEAKEQ
jgi:hypothetical protein